MTALLCRLTLHSWGPTVTAPAGGSAVRCCTRCAYVACVWIEVTG